LGYEWGTGMSILGSSSDMTGTEKDTLEISQVYAEGK
jgi:hypothetical protein